MDEGKTRGVLAAIADALRAPFNGGSKVARAEERASLAERRLREAIDVMPEGLVFLDHEGRYVLWNKKYAEMYHRSADLFREGVRLADTLRVGVERGDYPEAIGREEEWLTARLALLSSPGQRHEQLLADGRWVLIEERKTADGGVIGLRVDITEMKAQSARLEEALAQAQAANRAKGEFLANMSHEIRTPLNGVIGLADVLSRAGLDGEQRDILSTIMRSASDLNMLLGDMLDFTRLEAGKLEICPAPFFLVDLVEDCAALFQPSAESKGLRFRMEIAPEAGGQVLGDAGRLRQILTNLLSNAVKFTAQGEVALLVTHADPDGFRFEVRDTGPGFDPADTERLFARFEQADSSTTRKFGGTGLGLAICRQLAELMGGRVWAEGRPGEGSVFMLSLPMPLVEHQAVCGEAADEIAVGGALRVLVADDNEINRKVVELMLASIGAEVVCVENGALAVQAIEEAPFDVVLMDLQMPVMDGLSATRAIIDLENRGLPSAPVIVLSANVSAADHAASAAAGARTHIGKPIRAEELIGAIGQVLEERPFRAVA